MGESDAIIASVLDEPNDDAPILALCDWLEERGDDRGRLLRRYFKMSRKERDRAAATIRYFEEFFARTRVAEWREVQRTHFLDGLRLRHGEVEWRLVGWFARHFPDEFVRRRLAATVG